MKKILFFMVLFFPVSVLATDVSTSSVLLQAMDKITGRVQKIEIFVGQKVRFGELEIQLEKCLKKPPEETPENAAFLKIAYSNQPDKEVFKGWMFSSNPALSAMEDAVYDIWVDSCLEGPEEIPSEQVDTSDEMDLSEVISAPIED